MEEMHICQSCGRIIDSPELLGTHGDGHRNEDYCINCFENGVFSCGSEVVQPVGLKRWMKDEDKASWILDRCGYVILSTINEEGFPRPVAIDVIAHDGIREIWMTTYRNSAKARHLLRDQKAGVAFVREADSASLTGKAEVVTDKDTLRRYWKDFFSHYYPDGPYDEKNYGLMASILSSHSESVAFIPSASQWVFRNNSITARYRVSASSFLS